MMDKSPHSHQNVKAKLSCRLVLSSLFLECPHPKTLPYTLDGTTNPLPTLLLAQKTQVILLKNDHYLYCQGYHTLWFDLNLSSIKTCSSGFQSFTWRIITTHNLAIDNLSPFNWFCCLLIHLVLL
jgi:hypothetical protein